MQQWSKTGAALLLVSSIIMLASPVAAGEAHYANETYGVNITADRTSYLCDPDCTAAFNVTNYGDINETAVNLTVFNVYSSDQSMIDFTLEERNGTGWHDIGQQSGDDYTLENHEFLNSTATTSHKTYEFRTNITADDTWGKWNITLEVEADSLPSPLNFTLDPYVDSITLNAPANDAVIDTSTPEFNYTFTSAQNQTLNASVIVDDTTFVNTTLATNDTATVVTANQTINDGNHSWKVWVDGDGDGTQDADEVSAARNMTIDTTAPNLNPQQPVDNANYSGDVSVNATWSDDTTAVVAQQYNLSNRSGTYYTGTLNDTVDVSQLADGVYNVSYNATDEAGNTQHAVDAVTITVDTTPPQLDPIAPGANANISDMFDVTAGWSDAMSGVATQQYNITNTTLQQVGTLNDTGIDSTGFADGTYSISYNATDHAGNVRARPDYFTVTIDNTVPTVTVHSPGNATYATANISLNTTANEVTDTWRYELDGNGTNVTFQPNQTTLTGLDDGQHNITVYASDSAGNWGSTVQYFTVDTTPPQLTPRQPVDNANVSGMFSVNATWQDDTTTVVSARFNLSNSSMQKEGALNRTVNSTQLADGDYDVRYNATDEASNTEWGGPVTITVDNTPPSFVFNETNATDAGTYIDHRLRWSEDTTDLETYTFAFDNGTGTLTNDSETAFGAGETWSNVTKYTNETGGTTIRWRVYATDSAGNTKTSDIFVYEATDVTPPLWRNQQQNVSQIEPGQSVDLSAEGRDETNLSHAILATNETGGWSNVSAYGSPTLLSTQDAWTTGQFDWRNTSIDSGTTVAWKVWFNDSAGNWNHTDTVTFLVNDTVPPAVSVASPADGASVLETVEVDGTATDAGSAVDAFQYRWMNDSGLAETAWREMNDTFDTTTISNGYYNLSFRANDTNGNINDSVKVENVLVDNEAPTVTSMTPADGENVSDMFWVNASAADTWSSVDTVWFNLTNASGTVAAAPVNDTVDSTTLADGDYTVNYNATDTVGNTETITDAARITIDNSLPSLTPTAPADGAILSGSVDVAAVWSDAGTGVQEHMYNLSDGSGTAVLSGVLNDTIDTSTIADGAYDIGYNATDHVQNTVWETIGVTVDNTVPGTVTVQEFETATEQFAGWKRDNHTLEVDCSDATSGVQDMALFADGNRYAGWETAVPTNFTIDDTGNTTYTVNCRDKAGLINDSQTRQIAVDADAPVVSDTAPRDSASDVSTSFTFEATFSDESGESGVNVSASTLSLQTGGAAGSMSTPVWTNSSVSADISSLEDGTTYTVAGIIVDNVGHTHTFSTTFETETDDRERRYDGPVADAGGPYTVTANSTVTLNGTASTGSPMRTYHWTVTDDPTGEARLENASTVTPTFIAPTVTEETDISVTLRVEDRYADDATATITVTPPTAPETPQQDDTDKSEDTDDTGAEPGTDSDRDGEQPEDRGDTSDTSPSSGITSFVLTLVESVINALPFF